MLPGGRLQLRAGGANVVGNVRVLVGKVFLELGGQVLRFGVVGGLVAPGVFRNQQGIVDALSDRFLAAAAEGVSPLGVTLETVIDERRPSLPFDAEGVEIVRAAAAALGHASLETMTVAGHDVLALQRRIPGTLIFVPSEGGLSHNEREFTEAADLDRGLDVLAETLWRMVTDEG